MNFNLMVAFLLVGGYVVMAAISKSGSLVEKDCPKKRLKDCMNHLQAINKDHNLAFASTEAELINMCRTMQQGLNCVYDHVTRCFPKKSRLTFYQLLDGTRKVIELLCSPGSFRRRYMSHAPCMKNVSTEPEICGVQYQALVHSVTPREGKTASDTTRRQCCAYHSYLLCVTEVTELKCGSDTANFMKEYSEKTAGPLIQNQCKNYLAGSMMCSIGAASLPLASSWLSLLAFFVTLQYIL